MAESERSTEPTRFVRATGSAPADAGASVYLRAARVIRHDVNIREREPRVRRERVDIKMSPTLSTESGRKVEILARFSGSMALRAEASVFCSPYTRLAASACSLFLIAALVSAMGPDHAGFI